MLGQLERAKICEQQLVIADAKDAESQKQLEIVRGTIKLLEDQIAIYKSMAEIDKNAAAAKDKACAEQIKAAKPTFLQDLGKYFIGAGVGGAGLLLILLL
jgi:hypothetical protein